MATMNEGSEHQSEASSMGTGGGSEHGQQGNRRPRRKKRGNKKEDVKAVNDSGGAKSGKKKSGRSKSPKAGGHATKQRPAVEMSVIVNSVYLWDVSKEHTDEYVQQQQTYHQRHHMHPNHQQVAPYHFAPDMSCGSTSTPSDETPQSVVTIRAPHSPKTCQQHVVDDGGFSVIDTSFPNPHPPSVVHDKYWCQRRRLFSRFDMGVQLDSEGWFSVTPEIIADHVAKRVGELADSAAFQRGLPGSDIGENEGIVVLDAFCGCGGNAIAFGKIPRDKISLVVCVDIDRSKLRKAAYNASLYDIPNDKLVFIECNTMFVLMQCYKNGELVVDKLGVDVANMPASVETEDYAGYRIGGLESLPTRIDAVFMDPPWGGVDYSRQNSYDLEKNMKILIGPSEPVAKEQVGGLTDDFFDTFSSKPSRPKKGLYNKAKEGEYANGMDLVKMAALATKSHLVIYDLPRNTTKTSLGKSALAAGYRGNIKLEEHYLNGRLKTVTAYLGADYTSLLKDGEQ
mmetsp:Transcript_14639/g.26531  ORF Transcript_14639/g.26531 Transcript_14639/m.26531 type:complete len:510 (+) Transcript_14639:134-1663(+)|eukprot:CAMPEP_0202494114 /NCGR_PEP_ID=MMETSP1361-20130828/10757_1 /ASSEMBLY_ACC=CAM_ASM_000849 /TAXON_ID=210615 /ORGANISM="Staurosira complex sp., Strain CCMP2646" /LENGTH=509 /DNA_ID=CAMNT_0049124523 /DNA_START=134 /DNA_END=1663 /DNA_ORIENTATION=+